MHWYYAVAYFLGGAFLVNSIPHIGNGLSGRAFQTPFASPPGVGLSSSTVNFLWGFVNLAVAYVLVLRVGRFDLRNPLHAACLGAGMAVLGVFAAHNFGRFHGGR